MISMLIAGQRKGQKMGGKGDPGGEWTGHPVPQWKQVNHVKGREREQGEQGFVKLERVV